MAYASKYYDPVKAHEYYEKHKKLKGRRSTRGFTQNQKAQWQYGKDQIKADEKAEKSDATSATRMKKQAISEDAKEKRQAIGEKAKADRKKFTEDCKAKVTALREKLKNMSPERKAVMRERINGQIAQIREQFASKKVDVSAKATASR